MTIAEFKRQQNEYYGMILLAMNHTRELNREAGLWLSPMAKVREHSVIQKFFGTMNGMTDNEVVELFREASGQELVMVEVDGQMMLVEVATKWELRWYDLNAEYEAKAKAAYDEVLDRTDDEEAAEEAYDKVMAEFEVEEEKLSAEEEAEIEAEWEAEHGETGEDEDEEEAA